MRSVFLIALVALCSAGVCPESFAQNREPLSRVQGEMNRLSYLNSQDSYYLGREVPGGAASRWQVESKLGEHVFLDLDRVRNRVDLVRSLVERVNRRELKDCVLRVRGRREGAWRVADLNGEGYLDVVEIGIDASRTLI